MIDQKKKIARKEGIRYHRPKNFLNSKTILLPPPSFIILWITLLSCCARLTLTLAFTTRRCCYRRLQSPRILLGTKQRQNRPSFFYNPSFYRQSNCNFRKNQCNSTSLKATRSSGWKPGSANHSDNTSGNDNDGNKMKRGRGRPRKKVIKKGVANGDENNNKPAQSWSGGAARLARAAAKAAAEASERENTINNRYNYSPHRYNSNYDRYRNNYRYHKSVYLDKDNGNGNGEDYYEDQPSELHKPSWIRGNRNPNNHKNNPNNFYNNDTRRSSSFQRSRSTNDDTSGTWSKGVRSMGSLRALTKVIDKQLYANGPRGARNSDYPRAEGPLVHQPRDSMSSLLGYNQVKGDWKSHSSQNTFNIAIVFGKPLINDQITVEYASRIRTLVKLLKNEPEFQPSLICFCGSRSSPSSQIAIADAGYIFFRHVCEINNIDLTGVEIFVDNLSGTEEEAIHRITNEVIYSYAPQWLQIAAPLPIEQHDQQPPYNNNNIDPKTQIESDNTMEKYHLHLMNLTRKKIQVHFTLISTEYHLCNINDIHHRSPGQSILKEIEKMGESMKEAETPSSFSNHPSQLNRNNNFYENEFRNPFNANQVRRKQPEMKVFGDVETSWSFQYATYPFVYAKDDAVVFLGKCFLLGEELMSLLTNIRGVVDQKEFFQRDNYLMLASIRRSLVTYVEDLHKPETSIKAGLKIHSRKMFSDRTVHDIYTNSGTERDIIAVLESALISLGRCIDLARPAGLLVSSVSKEDWIKALHALEHALQELSYCDPDQQLHPSEWGKPIDYDNERVHKEWVRPNYYQDKEKRLEHEKKMRLGLENEMERDNILPSLGAQDSLFPISGEDDLSMFDEALMDDGMDF